MVASGPRRPNTWIAAHDPLHVVALADPLIDALGHEVRSEYVETYWLPILGPSAVWAARRLVGWLGDSEGVTVPLGPLAASLGLGSTVSTQSPMVRTLSRLVDFGLAGIVGTTYAVRRRFPPLPMRFVERLPEFLAECHRRDLEVVR